MVSEISKALTRYLKNSNTNVYQISQNSDLDRTMMQKMVKGTKLPSLKFFLKFIDYLILNEDEKNELIKQFKLEKIGADKYYTRLAVQDLIVHFQEMRSLYKESKEKLLLKTNERPDLLSLNSTSTIRSAIFYLIDREMEQENPQFSFDNFRYLSDIIEKIVSLSNYTHKKPCLKEYIHLSRKLNNWDDTVSNINLLRSILPIAFTFGNDYQVYYNYMNISKHDTNYLPFPHYFITSNKLVLISGDCKRGIMINNREITDDYLRELDVVRRHSHNFFTHYYTLDKGIEQYEAIKKSPVSVIFSTSPTETLLLKGIIRELPDDMQKIYDRVSINLDRQMYPDFKWIFSLDRMDAFFRDGILPDHYAKYTTPLTKKQRRQAAENFIEGLKKYPYFYLVKNPELYTGADIDVRLITPKTLSFYSSQTDRPYDMIIVKEGGIYNAFMDYFNSLVEDGDVYDPEETCAKVEEIFNQLMKRYDI